MFLILKENAVATASKSKTGLPLGCSKHPTIIFGLKKLPSPPYNSSIVFLSFLFLSNISRSCCVTLVMYQNTTTALAKKGLLLDWEPECAFELVSIVSPIRDYRLCWLLNHQLGYQLKWKEELPLITAKGKQKALFNLYAYHDELNWLQYYFINNKYLGEHLVPELKQVDHFLLIEGNQADQAKAAALHMLRQSPMVQAVFDVDANGLRSKQNLIFE